MDGRAADARARALKYARAVGEASLPDPPASIDTTDRDAVALALDRARREARLLRRQLDVVQAEARQLEAEESVVLEAARSLDEDVDAFGEFCDETVGRCARRRLCSRCVLVSHALLNAAAGGNGIRPRPRAL